MSIMNIFKSKVTSLVTDCDQSASEALIELATFFYRIDRRVSLEEQNFMDELLEAIEWNSSVNVETFQKKCISKVNDLLGKPEDQVSLYLSNLMQEISELGAAAKAKELAKEISDADGEIADDEVKYLDLVMSY